MNYFCPVYISALTGKRVDKVLTEAKKVYENAGKRISTGTLNDVLSNLIQVNEPPTKNGRRLKIYYATQPSALPPTFVLFVNEEKIMHFSYRRYLENGLREAFDFTGTPIKIVVRNKTEES
jgi:GTP-binding protein